jgi:hypothetical protein
LLHVLMSLAMIAMVLPWRIGSFVVPQAAFFAASSLWFVAVAMVAPSSPARGPSHLRLHSVFHAAMMAAMVWMLLPVGLANGAVVSEHGNIHHDGAGRPMWSALIGVTLAVGLPAGSVVLIGGQFRPGLAASRRDNGRVGIGALTSLGMAAMVTLMLCGCGL